MVLSGYERWIIHVMDFRIFFLKKKSQSELRGVLHSKYLMFPIVIWKIGIGKTEIILIATRYLMVALDQRPTMPIADGKTPISVPFLEHNLRDRGFKIQVL
ncbi:uncharacterized protein LOC120112303 [Phoenix dactylifera]|uniref:Uncharacterized protein LOC120112303 n=1 Tax=Phoenix dactylifera TaxID=42345 RepID=A0A8B9AN82_PHODC|nr:uncharacterized protein LOC120112303 [Phoenix dactylifera]